MKLQGMTILYIMIIIPMLIVISLTFSFYKEQLHKKLEYNSELTGAVNDAITAFELNSSGQDYSNVSDNFTSLVEASVNVFRRSIATRLNMTNADESLMNRYFPLALFTGYNGYYIYSPTYSPVVVKNPYTGQAAFSSELEVPSLEVNSGTYKPKKDSLALQYTPVLLKHHSHVNDGSTSDVRVTTDKDLNKNIVAKEEIDYSLKQLIPYSTELQKGDDKNNKIYVNFTLDNYISFFGKIKGVSYNKSGYLLNYDTSLKLTKGSEILYDINNLNQSLVISDLTYFDEYVDDYIEDVLTKGTELVTLDVKENDEEFSIVFDPIKFNNGFNKYTATNRKQMTGEYAYQRQQLDAIKYYIKAANFSNFVYKNLTIFTEADIKDIELDSSVEKYSKYFLEYDHKNNEAIFSNNKRVLDFNSTFNEIKRKVIRNSLQYDLIIATENYNYLVSSSDFILNLPVITDSDWERIIDNISFTAFLQGLSIGGGKTFSDYSIATSTMNEFVITPETIFFANIDGFNQGAEDGGDTLNEDLYYHKIDCPDFLENLMNKNNHIDDDSTGAVGFKMGEWLYDARWSKEKASFEYDHKNYSHFGCISNYNRDKDIENNTNQEKLKIYTKNLLSALAAEKERSFKPNYIIDGGGYITSNSNSISLNSYPKSGIKGIEIASDLANNDVKNFSIEIKTSTNSFSYDTERSTNIVAFPFNTSDLHKSKYEIHRYFIKEMKDKFGNNALWENIKSVEVSAPGLSYVKVLFI